MKAVQASGHLARLPTLPQFQVTLGWSFSATYFHATLMGGSNQAAADTLPRFPRTTLTVQLDADIKTNVDLAILTPAYTFATPVWGGRLGFNLFIPVGTARTQIDALATGALGPIGFATQNSVSDRLISFGDPAPQLSLKWNEGVNNFMVYSRGGIPIGDYDPDRIVNLGDGHASWDNGFGYTYFNATTGLEFSAVSGLTYNFTNPHTDYREWHRLACRLGSFPLPLEAVLCRCRRLLFQSADGRYWYWRYSWCLYIAHFCCRSRSRGFVSCRGKCRVR